MIWFCLLIPVASILFLVLFKREEMAWWEYLVQFLIPVLAIVAAKYIAVHSMTTDKEYWNNYAVEAQHDEPWDEYIHQTCTRTVSCGDNCTTTETYDCSYVDRHPEMWRLLTNGGGAVSVGSSDYNMARSLWKNEKFVDMHRNYHSYDGDRYTSRWPGHITRAEIVPVTTTHKYENRIQVPNEVLNYDEVNTADVRSYGLYQYQWDYYTTSFNPLMGENNAIAADTLRVANANWGMARQMHIMVLVFDGKPSMAGHLQEALWKGGNKNEFVVCVGKKDGDITWVHVFSWTTAEVLKVEVRNEIRGMLKYDIVKIANYVATRVPQKYVRRQFAEFSYIQVNPSTKAVVWTFVVVLLLTVGLAVFHVMNPFSSDNHSGSYRYRRGRW